jgi:hypothetical protein
VYLDAWTSSKVDLNMHTIRSTASRRWCCSRFLSCIPRYPAASLSAAWPWCHDSIAATIKGLHLVRVRVRVRARARIRVRVRRLSGLLRHHMTSE